MRHVSSGFVSLLLLGCSIGSAIAQQNVCVKAADGAVVCGPVTQDDADKASPNPFDQPAQPLTQSLTPVLPPAATTRPAPNRVVTNKKPPPHPPQLARRPPPPRDVERRPVGRVAHEDPRRQFGRNMPPPPRRAERGPPPRYADMDRRRFDRPPPPPMPRGERDMARQYDARLRELEREIHQLRSERDAAMRHAPPRPVYRGPPPRYMERDTRREDIDRLIAQTANRRAERE